MLRAERKALEKEAQARIISALEQAGYRVARSQCAKLGDPDLLAERGATRLAIEVKAHGKKKLGLWQGKRLLEYRRMGYIADVAFGYDDFMVKFRRYL